MTHRFERGESIKIWLQRINFRRLRNKCFCYIVPDIDFDKDPNDYAAMIIDGSTGKMYNQIIHVCNKCEYQAAMWVLLKKGFQVYHHTYQKWISIIEDREPLCGCSRSSFRILQGHIVFCKNCSEQAWKYISEIDFISSALAYDCKNIDKLESEFRQIQRAKLETERQNKQDGSSGFLFTNEKYMEWFKSMTKEEWMINATNKITEECCKGAIAGGINHCMCACCIDKKLRDLLISNSDAHQRNGDHEEWWACRKEFGIQIREHIKYHQEKPMKFAGIWKEPECNKEEEQEWYLRLIEDSKKIIDLCAVDKNGEIIGFLLEIRLPTSDSQGEFYRYDSQPVFEKLGFKVNKKGQIYAS